MLAFAQVNPKAIDLNEKDSHGFTVFHEACIDKKTDVVKKLLAFAQSNPKAIDLNNKPHFGNTAIRGFQIFLNQYQH